MYINKKRLLACCCFKRKKKTMTLVQFEQDVSKNFSFIDKKIILIQRGVFYECYNKSKSQYLADNYGLKLHSSNISKFDIVGIHTKNIARYSEKIVADGSVLFLVKENAVSLRSDERRQKIPLKRSLCQILTFSKLHSEVCFIVDLSELTVQKIDNDGVSFSVNSSLQKYDNNNVLFAFLMQQLFATKKIEIFFSATFKNEKNIFENNLKHEDCTVVLHEINAEATMHNVMQLLNFENSSGKVGNKRKNITQVLQDVVFDTPCNRTDILVDATTFKHLKILNVEKRLQKKVKSRDGKQVLSLLLAYPGIKNEYFDALESIRFKVKTADFLEKNSNLFFFAKKYLSVALHPVANTAAFERPTHDLVQKMLLNLSYLLKLNQNLSKVDLLRLMDIVFPQLRLNFKPVPIDETAIETAINGFDSLLKKLNFNPLLLKTHFYHMCRLKNFIPIEASLKKNNFLVVGYETNNAAKIFCDTFGERFEIETFEHERAMQKIYNSIRALVNKDAVLTLAVKCGLVDVYANVSGCYAKFSEKSDDIVFENLRSITQPNNKPNTNCLSFLNILRGANGSGKTTFALALARSVYVAQCGLPVQASQFIFSPKKELFLRFGAEDNFLENLSAFENESLHMSQILRNSSKDSLVCIDELGLVAAHAVGINVSQHVLNELHEKKSFVLFLTHFEKDLEKNLKDLNIKAWSMSSTLPYEYKLQKDNTSRFFNSGSIDQILKKIGYT